MTAPIAPTLQVAVPEEGKLSIAGWIQSGDTLHLRYGTDPTLASYSEATVVVGSSRVIDFGLNIASFGAGVWYFGALTERSAELSNLSPIVSIEVVSSYDLTVVRRHHIRSI